MNDNIKQLQELIKAVPLRRVVIEEDVNTLYQSEGQTGILNTLKNAEEFEQVKEVSIINVALPFNPFKDDWNKQAQTFIANETNNTNTEAQHSNTDTWDETKPKLNILHENKLQYTSKQNHYYILGQLPQDISSMRITLMVEDLIYGRKERSKIDLYERAGTRLLAEQIADSLHQSPELIEADFLILTDLLEKHREQQLQQERQAYKSQRFYQAISPQQKIECIDFLSKPNLIPNIDKLIESTGVVGEQSTRKLLFVIASTYKMTTPLHSLVHGSSGSGKSHLINSIGQCFPPEDVISMTRVTSKSFYHYNKDELVDKLILIQDYDGLDEDAQYAFRELQSAGNISSSTTYKDKFGNLVSAVKVVRSHFASLLATTKAEVYYDNMSRSVILGVDECDTQTVNIINYQNKKLSGQIDGKEEQKIRVFLQNCMRCIQPMEVVNKYADRIKLPIEAKMLRRLNSHYQSFVKQITILHQYQRQRDEQGRLIAEPEDLQIACDILFDAIMIKVDDLDTSLRQFFDRMKSFIKTKNNNQPDGGFTQRELRLTLNISKTQCFRYMEDLELLEYIQKTGGYSNKGYKYKIVYWDDMDKIKDKVKAELNKQLALLPHAA